VFLLLARIRSGRTHDATRDTLEALAMARFDEVDETAVADRPSTMTGC
jgi:hypothetical protein